jgi:hypothetical protein
VPSNRLSTPPRSHRPVGDKCKVFSSAGDCFVGPFIMSSAPVQLGPGGKNAHRSKVWLIISPLGNKSHTKREDEFHFGDVRLPERRREERAPEQNRETFPRASSL